jgi:hypothetical protein
VRQNMQTWIQTHWISGIVARCRAWENLEKPIRLFIY